MWRCCRTPIIFALTITLSIDRFSSAESNCTNGSRVVKRQAESSETSYLCDLRVIGDFRWYRHVTHRNTTYGTELVKSLLLKVDQIFRTLDTDGDGLPNNIGFFLRDLIIHDHAVQSEYGTPEDWNPKHFFDEFRDYDFSGACAGLLLTYRPLSFDMRRDMPTVPKTNLASFEQGICSRYVPPAGPAGLLPDYGVYVSNALPVNFMIPDHRVASPVSMVIQTVHQLGHLFGARDDADTKDDQRCRPILDVDRNYIMGYPFVSGLTKRNFQWSPCSRETFGIFLRVLNTQGRSCLRPCSGPSCMKVVTEEGRRLDREDDIVYATVMRADESEHETTEIPGGTWNVLHEMVERMCDVETTLTYDAASGGNRPNSSLTSFLLTGAILAAIARFLVQET